MIDGRPLAALIGAYIEKLKEENEPEEFEKFIFWLEASARIVRKEKSKCSSSIS